MSHTISYIAGMCCGIAAVFLLVLVIRILCRRHQSISKILSTEITYDERQILARGKAYQTAFLVLVGYVLAASFLDELLNCPVLMSFGGLWLGVCLSILVFVCICIWRDAYLSLQENAKEFNIMGIVISILNLIPGFLSLSRKQPFLVNGSISYRYINLMVGGLFLLITLLFDLKLIYDKRAEE